MRRGKFSAQSCQTQQKTTGSRTFFRRAFWVWIGVTTIVGMVSSYYNCKTLDRITAIGRDRRRLERVQPPGQTSSSDRQQELSGKPLFILHVGPAKTATTTLQCHFGTHLPELEKDNIHYIGHFYPHKYCGVQNYDRVPNLVRGDLFGSCIRCEQEQHCNCTNAWNNFEKAIALPYLRNQTVLMSDEMFAQYLQEGEQMDTLVKQLSKWNVRILYTYRRLHQIFPSAYGQVYDPDAYESMKPWPTQGGDKIPSLNEYFLRSFRHRIKELTRVRNQWDKYFPGSLRVANIHTKDERGFVNHFVCEMMPEAQELCRVGTEAAGAKSNSGESKALPHWDRIAVAAFEKGWIKDSVDRPTARKAVEEFAKSIGLSTLNDFKLDCLSAENTELLFNQSSTFEEESIPRLFASAEGQNDLRMDFSNIGRKFCSVDVEATLQDRREEWMRLFSSL